MEKFEIHITGDEKIIKILDKFKLKSIIVDLYSPNNELIRTEYMSSFIRQFNDFESCLRSITGLVKIFIKYGIAIYRVKIESPYYTHYINQSLYIETHFEAKNNNFPISINRKSKKIIATDRTCDKNKYEEFLKKWKGNEIELCLYDTDKEQDEDWLTLFKNEKNPLCSDLV